MIWGVPLVRLARRLLALLAGHRGSEVTTALDAVYATEDSRLDPVFVELQARSLPHEEW